MNKQINNGAGDTDAGALVQDNTTNNLYMVLESVRAEYEATDEFGGWRLGPDDPAMGDTFWIAREDAQSGWAAAAPESDDGEPPLPDHGRPLRLPLNWTGHSLTGGQDAPRIRLGRRCLEIVALADDVLMTFPQRYDHLAPRERIAAITAAVLVASILLTGYREAALDRLAGTIRFGDFGRGALEHRRSDLDWLLDGMASDIDIVPGRYGVGLVPQSDPLHPRNASESYRDRWGSTRPTPRLSKHGARRARTYPGSGVAARQDAFRPAGNAGEPGENSDCGKGLCHSRAAPI